MKYITNNYLRFSLFAFLAVAVLLCLGSTPVSAMSDVTTGGHLSADIVPANPGPNTLTNITLTSFSTDLAGATITWTINGREVKKGVGETRVTFTTERTGTPTTIHITVNSTEGTTIEKTLSFAPQGLDIAWEAETYVPTLYKGKALPSPGSIVRVVALPDFRTAGGRKMEPKELVYTWKQGFKDVPGGSGKGLQSSKMKMNNIGKTKIAVDVASTDGTLRASKEIEIETTAPELLIYEDRPLLGTQYNAPIFGSFALPGSEATLRAEPFYISTIPRTFGFSWLVGGTPGNPDPENPQLITLRHETENQGEARIEVLVTHPEFLFESAKASLTAQFGQ